MPSGMSVGSPVLKIRNIDKVLTFYEKEVGLRINKKYHDDNDDLMYELSSKYVPFCDKRSPLLILQYIRMRETLFLIQLDSITLQYLFPIEGVLLQPMWSLNLQESISMVLLIIKSVSPYI